MALLPTEDDFNNPATTNAEQKSHLASLRNFLAGLLGTDSADTAGARARLGVPPRAASINVASVAGAVNLTVAAPDTDDIVITGALVITSFTGAVGRVFRVRAAGAFTLTNNASIVTQTGADIVAAVGDTFMLRFADDGVAEVLCYAGGVSSNLKWLSKGIGEFYVVDDSIPGADIPPTDNPLFRYISLTAGLTGVAGYNNGCLTSESVTGSAPFVAATAVISLAGSPMSGQQIDLLNTEARVLRAGTAPGAKLQDAAQGHKHTMLLESSAPSGAGGVGGSSGTLTKTTLNTVTDGVNGTPRTDVETRAKSLTVTFYQRIL